MTDVNLCVDFPPDYKSLYDSAKSSLMELFNPNQFQFPGQFEFPPFNITFPSINTIPASGPYQSFCARIEQFVNEMCTKAVLLVFDAIVSFLDGIGLTLAVPTLFGITLVDLITDTFEELAVKYTGPTLQGFSTTFSSETEDLRRALQNLAVTMVQELTKNLTDVLEDIKDLVPAFVIPDLPAPVPTLDELKDLLYAQISPRTDLNYDDLFNFSLDGFDIDVGALLPPGGVNPFSKIGGYDLEQGIKILLLKLTTLPLTLITEALEAIGLTLNIGFCLLFPVS